MVTAFDMSKISEDEKSSLNYLRNKFPFVLFSVLLRVCPVLPT
jgi:hypothetical protein